MLALCWHLAVGQTQDSTLNNLQHTEGYLTGIWGQLGAVKKTGNGPTQAILLPGWGFDASIFDDFAKRHQHDMTMFIVTIPGFGNTPSPPMPPDNEVFSNLNWTKGVIKGLTELIQKEKLNKPIIITCFTYSNIIAMRIALDYPELVGKIIMISGMAKFTMAYASLEPRSLQDRIKYIDNLLSKRWFKTVSRETWDNGNFAPGTFSKDSLKAKRHWNMMSAVPIPVMVRYLCELYCMDLSLEYSNLKVPTLVLAPSFTDEFLSDTKNSYAMPFFHSSWLGAQPASDKIKIITLTGTHAFIMDDQPEKLDAVVGEFISGRLSTQPVR